MTAFRIASRSSSDCGTTSRMLFASPQGRPSPTGVSVAPSRVARPANSSVSEIYPQRVGSVPVSAASNTGYYADLPSKSNSHV
jgi:hypothetical protein